MNKKVLVSALMVVSLFLQPLTAFGAFARNALIFPVGQLNVSLSPVNVLAANIQAGKRNVQLATFDLVATGEDILIRRIAVQVSGSVNIASITNARLVDNQGRVLFGPIVNGNFMGLFTFMGNATVQKNSRTSLKLLVDVSPNALNGKTFRASIAGAASLLAIGSASGNQIQPAGRFPIVGSTMTIVNLPHVVQVGSLTVTNNLSLPAGVVIAGSANVALMKINLTASNVEDVELSSLAVNIGGVEQNDLQMVKFVRDSTGETIYSSAIFNANPVFGGNLAQRFTIRRGMTEVITVQADITNMAFESNFTTSVERAADVTGIGRASAAQVQILGNFPVRGPQIRVTGNGSLAVAAGNLVGQNNITVGNDRTLAAFDFTASNEDVLISELKLNFAGNPALVPFVKIVRQDTNELLYQGSVVGGQLDAVFFNANLIVQKDNRLTLLVKADVTDQFINPGDNNRVMSFNIQSVNDIEAMGMMSSMVILAQGNFPILGPVMTLQASNSLRVSLSNEVQLNGFLLPGLNTLAGFKLEAGSEALQVRDLKIKLMSNNFANIQRVTFSVRSGMDEQVVYSGLPTMLGGQMAEVGGALNTYIDLGEYSSKILVVKVQLVGGNIGDVIQAQIERATDISALSQRSAELVDVLGVFPMMAGVQRF